MSKRVIIHKNYVSEETMNISTLLQGLASFAWIGFIGALVMIFVRASRNQPAKGLTSLGVVLLVAALLLTSIGAGLVFLQANERSEEHTSELQSQCNLVC